MQVSSLDFSSTLANEIIKKHILIEKSRLLTCERVGSGDETIYCDRECSDKLLFI